MSKCRCGKKLPSVKPNETPYEFCSQECKALDSHEKLIAAAPEMYEALKEAVDLISAEYCSHITEYGPCSYKVEACYAKKQLAAIAKAEGKI